MLGHCRRRRADPLPINKAEPVAFGSRLPQGMTAMAISCRKSEVRLNLPHEQFCLSAYQRPPIPDPSACHRGKTERKNFSAIMSRKPLKRFNSDERIQGNPRKSNAPHRGLSQQNIADALRLLNSPIGRTGVATAANLRSARRDPSPRRCRLDKSDRRRRAVAVAGPAPPGARPLNCAAAA
jgi:hypothetical protein